MSNGFLKRLKRCYFNRFGYRTSHSHFDLVEWIEIFSNIFLSVSSNLNRCLWLTALISKVKSGVRVRKASSGHVLIYGRVGWVNLSKKHFISLLGCIGYEYLSNAKHFRLSWTKEKKKKLVYLYSCETGIDSVQNNNFVFFNYLKHFQFVYIKRLNIKTEKHNTQNYKYFLHK